MSRKASRGNKDRYRDVRTRREAARLLDGLEQDFRQDLGVHLYSAFLMKLFSMGQYPSKRWTAWPLPYETLVDPKTDNMYIDEDAVADTKITEMPEAHTLTLSLKDFTNVPTAFPKLFIADQLYLALDKDH